MMLLERLNEENKNQLFLKIEQMKQILPIELHWVIQILKLKANGYELKFVYYKNGEKEIADNLKYWEIDSENQSFIPEMPDKIIVEKYIIGKGFKVISEFDCRKSFIDPPVDVAMQLWNLVNKNL